MTKTIVPKPAPVKRAPRKTAAKAEEKRSNTNKVILLVVLTLSTLGIVALLSLVVPLIRCMLGV